MDGKWGRRLFINVAVNGRGMALLQKFLDDEVPRLGKVAAIEQSFALRIASLDLTLVGVIDLVAEIDDVQTVIGGRIRET